MNFKTLAAASLASVAVLSAGAANAVPFPDFQVTQGVYGNGSGLASFTADKITGNYSEVFTVTGANSFAVSLRWNAGQFVQNDGIDPLAAGATGLGVGYGIYGLFQGAGTFSTVGGVTTFTLTSGGLNVYLDDNLNTTFVPPATGVAAYTVGSSGDDILLAAGSLVNGTGVLDPTLPTCGAGINCGSFGQTTSFGLTAAGSNFFTSPVPFYNLAFQSGQLNNFAVSGTQTINGSLDAVFSRVPEPGSLALLSVVLLGLGAVRRKKA